MGDVINLEKGFSPWRPAPDAVLAKEYAYYEIPLAGVIEQAGVRYFFHSVAVDEHVSLWVYMHLSPTQEDVLDSASREDFMDAVNFEGAGMLALALEGPGIVATYLMDPLSREAIKDGYRVVVSELAHWLEGARELEHELIPG